uniref:Uncharacterized protein n=1 Tax=Anopheles dirus TaxID=7168 RepID=A0A182N113_9DIPT
MDYRFAVCCLLLLLAGAATAERAFFQTDPSTYCPIPKDVLEGKRPDSGADYRTDCERRRQEDANQVKQLIAIIAAQLKKQANAANAFRAKFSNFADITRAASVHPELDAGRKELDELRAQVLVVAIEADRIADAFNQYLVLAAWNSAQSIVDRIYQNPRRHWRHIESLLGFIRILPSREERITFYHHLQRQMVAHKHVESYVGVMFASDARGVVYGADGKQVLNATDERTLWTAMVDGAAGYFRRALLTGANRYDLIRLDRDHPELFDLIFTRLFKISDGELKGWSSWRMLETPCLMHRPKSKARLFYATINMLKRRFKWPKQNQYYIPMFAGFLQACMPELERHEESNVMVPKLKQSFAKLTYEGEAQKIGKRIHSYAG